MRKIFTVLLLLASLPLFSRMIYFVKPTASDANNGTSWATAFRTLQKALSVSISGSEIWVAAGTYYPDEIETINNNDRQASFNLKNGVALYGGFAGTETQRSQRTPEAHATILSGDIDLIADNSGNAYHVVRGVSLDSTAVLDGFTITGGHADGYYASEYDDGGGLYMYGSSPQIANCTFKQNTGTYGGGVYNDQSSSPTLANCSFIQNTASVSGGGICNDHASAPVLTNCRFSANKAYQGGGLYNDHTSSPSVINCSITQNKALSDGGGLYNNNTSAPTLINCSFWKDSADRGGGLYNYNSSPVLINASFWGNTATSGGALAGQGAYPTLTNCILWGNSSTFYEIAGNSTVTWSIVQGGYAGAVNRDIDPLFRNAAGGDLRLQFTSPARNAGNNSVITVATDLDGRPRVTYGSVDMGAYEFQPGEPGGTIYVKSLTQGGNDANNGDTWGSAFATVQKALSVISSGQVWVAAGTYYPDEIDGTNSNNPAASFVLKGGVTMYGGFTGTETSPDQRILSFNKTTLSGDINQDGGFSGNSNTVVEGVSNAVLDGFTITGGSAYSHSPNEGGGGMFNYGSPTIRNCIFTLNQAYEYYSYGGAVFNYFSSPTFINCLFWNNAAKYGGAIFNYYCSSPPSFINCTFANNGGGAIFNQQASPNITNCILWANSGFQIANLAYFTSNPTVSHSIVQGGWNGSGTSNLQSDPLFVNAATGDLHLQPCSPAIDAGDQAQVTAATDLDGAPRTVATLTDMGAYEFQGTIYVKHDATGLNNGTSWVNAYSSLQDALAQSTGCPHVFMIWVAKGTYYPDEGVGLTNNDRSASFRLKNKMTILGGFAGTEAYLRQRSQYSARYYETILSGEIDGVLGNAGNAYHVVRSEGVDSSAVLDGFTITGGNANGSTTPDNRGGGLYSNSSPTVRYCTFNANNSTNGGALYNTAAASIINCIFTQNRASYGGAVYNESASPAVLNGLFWKNTATSQGGAIYDTAASPRIINGSFNSNTAPSGYGGALRNVSASAPTITNSILWGDSGGEISSASSTPVVSYSIVQGGYAGGSNILNVDPKFADVSTGKLSLTAYPTASPAIDAGNNAAVTLTTDVNGDERINNGIVDLGADEYYPSGKGGPEPLVLICPQDFTLQSGPGSCGAVVDYSGAHAATATGGEPPITITYDPAAGTLLPVGDVLVTVRAKDAFSTRICTFWVTVVDTVPPVITEITVDKPVLYPPNHKMQDVMVNYNVTDNCPGVITELSVTSNEREYGSGSGDASPDWQVVNDHKVQLRGERSGNGSDRIYTITITATDASGNTSTATTTVTVPHDSRPPVTMNQAVTTKEGGSLVVTAVPNPSADGFTLYTRSPSTLPLSIKVIDGTGRMIERRSGVVANGMLTIGNTYRPGVYYVQVVQGDVLQILKLVKQNR